MQLWVLLLMIKLVVLIKVVLPLQLILIFNDSDVTISFFTIINNIMHR